MAPLTTYNEKRDFKKTREPKGEVKKTGVAKKIFVVQEHHASHLHYDFRLEIEGVLKSWAVPKGPSLDPATKRLAVETEDHPMAYAKFKGAIPAGEYGGGTVYIWDSGTFEAKSDAVEGYEKGKLEFSLKGKKLKGKFVLVRSRFMGQRAWLLIKVQDEFALAGHAVEAQKPATQPSALPSGKNPPRPTRLPTAKTKTVKKNVSKKPAAKTRR